MEQYPAKPQITMALEDILGQPSRKHMRGLCNLISWPMMRHPFTFLVFHRTGHGTITRFSKYYDSGISPFGASIVLTPWVAMKDNFRHHAPFHCSNKNFAWWDSGSFIFMASLTVIQEYLSCSSESFTSMVFAIIRPMNP